VKSGNIRITILVLFAILTAFLPGGCFNPVSNGQVTGPNVLMVRISGASPAAKTVLLSLPAIIAY
jgi:hypothetical protein